MKRMDVGRETHTPASEGGDAAFRETLLHQGYIGGQNLLIEARYSQRSSSGAGVAADLVNMDLELVVVHSLPSALVAQKARPCR